MHISNVSRAEGGDLQTVLDTNEFLEEPLCIDVLRDTLKGLLFLHQHSIAHLDIKVSPESLSSRLDLTCDQGCLV
jgi:serine/threonine protein kinase